MLKQITITTQNSVETAIARHYGKPLADLEIPKGIDLIPTGEFRIPEPGEYWL